MIEEGNLRHPRTLFSSLQPHQPGMAGSQKRILHGIELDVAYLRLAVPGVEAWAGGHEGSPVMWASRAACKAMRGSPHDEKVAGQKVKAPTFAQFRASVGTTPSSRVTTTPRVMAAVVKAPGTLTVGPSAAGSEKYMSTITRR